MTTCKSCRWFDPVFPNTDLGLCRYNPPVPQVNEDSWLWPQVEPDDWCRMYQHSKQIPLRDDVIPLLDEVTP